MTLPAPVFQPLAGIFEPSAIQQLPDGRILVVEDEKSHPFCLLTLSPDGSVGSTPLNAEVTEAEGNFRKLDDLEGLALDPSGALYAITSHSRDGDGEEKKSRAKLVRFRIEGNRIVAPRVVMELKPALQAVHPLLASAAGILDVKGEGGLNIEALAFDPDGQGLLIGFRSPLLDGWAIIAHLENPAAMLESGEPPRIATDLVRLDLEGHGIRGMDYIPALGGYLVTSGPVAREQTQFRLWFWRGQAGEAPRRVTVPGLQGFEHAEGVSTAAVAGRSCIIIVSDDGNRKAGRCARYLLLDLDQLQIDA